MKKNILLVSCGIYPQVVTEVVYALTQKSPATPLSEVHVVTTDLGLKKIEEYLLGDEHGHFALMCQEYSIDNIKFDTSTVHVLKDHDDQNLDDIRSVGDHEVVANQITELVRDLTSDPDKSLYVSLVGGRRSASYFLGYALSLFGRVHDNLSQIIVCNDFQADDEFFYPNKTPTFITDREGDILNTQDAKITLAEIPFVRLRDGLPYSLLEGKVTFVEAVTSLQDFTKKGSVRIFVEKREIMLGAKIIKFPPTLFAWYSWLLLRIKERGEEGFLSLRSDCHLEFIDHLKKLFGSFHNCVESAEKSLAEGFEGNMNYIPEKNSRINKKINSLFGTNAYLYRIHSSGKKNKTQYSIAVDPMKIELVW